MVTDIRAFCDRHGACREGSEWAIANCRDMAEAWQILRPDWLLWVATREGVLNECQLRLFACWSARQAFTETTDPRSRNAVEVAERFARGEATRYELYAARSAARSAAESAAWSAAWYAAESAAWYAAWSAAWYAAWYAAWSAAEYAAWSAARSAAWSAARYAAWSAARSDAEYAAWSAARSDAWSAAESAQAAYIRASHPNPFIPAVV